jgi:hypothetical protein
LERFARAVKEEVRGGKLVFAFYGYLFDVAGFPNGAQVSGHLLTERVLRCPDIDVLCAPDFVFRPRGGWLRPLHGTGGFRPASREVVDQRGRHAHLSLRQDAGSGRVGTLPETLWVHQRNFAHALAHRCGLWWMDQGGMGGSHRRRSGTISADCDASGIPSRAMRSPFVPTSQSLSTNEAFSTLPVATQ